MAFRTLLTVQREEGRIICRVQWCNEWSEYRVTLQIDGATQEGAHYFTDDLANAKLTAATMVDNAKTQLTTQTRKLEWVNQ